MAFGVSLPTVIYEDADHGELVGASLPHSALGDLRLNLKATLLPGGELGGFSVAALGAVHSAHRQRGIRTSPSRPPRVSYACSANCA